VFRIFCISISVFISLTIRAQNQNKVLAKIGTEQISPKEFKLRYEFFPFINTSVNDDSVKSLFLYSLIAEKLFALEAKNSGLDETEKFNFVFKPLEKMFVRDALFEKEIKSKVKVENEEILEGIKKIDTKLTVEIFSSTDSNHIYRVFSDLNRGIPADSITNFDEKDSSEITFGTMNDEVLEDSLFSFSSGKYTNPVKTGTGWFVFYLKDKTSNVITDDAATRKKVEDIIKNRRIEKKYYDYFGKIFKNKTTEADKDLFFILSENIFNVLKEKNIGITDTSSQFYLDEGDFEKIKDNLRGNILNNIFFRVDNKPVTINDFLADLLLAGFSVKTINKNEINFKLSKLSKDLMEKEFLANLGYKQGLQNLPEVKEQLEMWKDNFLSQIYKNTFIDSARVNEKEVYDYYLKSQNGEKVKQVNIVELLTDSLEIIGYVLDQIRNGKGFKELAAEFTERKWTKNEGGEFGFFPVTMFGEIGRIANDMKIGDIYGPIKVDEGYSLFQLIDVKETEDSIVQSFVDVKDRMRNELMYKKFNGVLTKRIIELADKYKIDIDEGAFNSINLMKIKMFVHRFMGFGGRISAVPFTSPMYDWIYKDKSLVFP
jgi:parvulin-like peptidyl-prolyl isomerase